MAKKQKKRSEIAEQDKWDLTKFYADEQSFLKDLDVLKQQSVKVRSFKDKITQDAKTLLDFLTADRELSLTIHRIYIYAFLKSDEDCENTHHQGNLVRVANEWTKICGELSFINPELLKTPYSRILNFIKENSKLEEFAFALAEIYRHAPYVLSADKEEILSDYANVTQGFEKSFDFIKNSQLKYGTFKDGKGELVELTNSNYRLYMKNTDRNIRRKVFNLYFKQYQKNNFSLAENIMGFYKAENLEAKIRGYKSSLNQSLFANDIPEEVYINLITVVNKNLNVLGKYYDLVKEVTKIPTLTEYDLNTSLVDDEQLNYPYESAKKIILEALTILGPDYISVLEKAFNERWIDIYNNTGKHSGFYTMPNYVANPVILSNYESKFEDVSSLAHELGHAINCYFSAHNNPYQYFQNSIFVAEVASLTNELILSYYLLNKSTDKTEKLTIINHLISLYTSNLFSATKGANFELILHDKLQKNEPVTNETINGIWEDLLLKSYNNKVKSSPLAKYGWSTVPHFYSNFYYYQYATGISMATYVAKQIMAKNQDILKKYQDFLKAGSTDHPLNLLKKLGIEMQKPDVIEEAIKTFDELLVLFKEIYNS